MESKENVMFYHKGLSGAAMALLLVAGAAYGAPDPNVFRGGNHWLITAFEDATPNHVQLATQGICFQPPAVVGTHIRGTWYSTTFPNWNGTYSQEGDQVFMYGDFGKDAGHDGITFEIVGVTPRNASAGHWHEWIENGAYGITIGFGNTLLERVGECKVLAPGELPLNIPPRLLSNGAKAEHPLDPDQLPVLGITDLVK
jgi:hypothetical protein